MVCTVLPRFTSRFQGLGCPLASPNHLLGATFVGFHAALHESGALAGRELGQVQFLEGKGRAESMQICLSRRWGFLEH